MGKEKTSLALDMNNIDVVFLLFGDYMIGFCLRKIIGGNGKPAVRSYNNYGE